MRSIRTHFCIKKGKDWTVSSSRDLIAGENANFSPNSERKLTKSFLMLL